MSKEEKDRVGFSLKEIAALRWLAVALGALFAALCTIGRGSFEMLLGAGVLTIGMMIGGPLAILALRKRKSRGPRRP